MLCVVTARIAPLLACALFATGIAGCSDEAVEQFAAGHIEKRMVDGVVDWLEESCAPDRWCAPYAQDAASKCVSEHIDVESLVGLSEADLSPIVEAAAGDIHLCSLREVQARYASDKSGDI